MTYASAFAALKAPKFADPDAIAARDLVAAIDRAVELLLAYPVCVWCQGEGTEWNEGERCRDQCSGCFGAGISTTMLDQAFEDEWGEFDENIRWEALRRARTQREGQDGDKRTSGEGGAALRPLAIDLFCGKGGWTKGLLAAGFDVIGFDIERWADYPGELVLQDVLTLHGRQFREASLIVASPPCQAYSYRAMPWKRAKALGPPDNTLFSTCFRIQREASEAAGRHIPLIVENVKGAQPWVGRARAHYGSFYLWGDVPALMPFGVARKGTGGSVCSYHGKNGGGDSWQGLKGAAPIGSTKPNGTGSTSWFFGTRADPRDMRRNEDGEFTRFGIKQEGLAGPAWFDKGAAKYSSRSEARKAASAQIAMIPYPLARWIGEVYHP